MNKNDKIKHLSLMGRASGVLEDGLVDDWVIGVDARLAASTGEAKRVLALSLSGVSLGLMISVLTLWRGENGSMLSSSSSNPSKSDDACEHKREKNITLLKTGQTPEICIVRTKGSKAL